MGTEEEKSLRRQEGMGKIPEGLCYLPRLAQEVPPHKHDHE